MNPEFPPLLSSRSEAPAPAALAASTKPPHETFQRVFERLGAEVDRGERLVGGVISGRAASLGAGQLIALQAGIYRYTEIVDLSAKFIDRAASSVRTTLQSGG